MEKFQLPLATIVHKYTLKKQPETMNHLHPDKLLHSKWTAVTPQNKERHFVVCNIVDYKNQRCQIEAVLTRHRYIIDWQQLRDDKQWLTGWH